jgi:RNA polymerase-binding transcription factor DksA
MASETARARLTAAREAALARLLALDREHGALADAAAAAGTDDEHDPEGATLAFEREHAAALAGQARTRLAEINAALGRLADGSYGTCERCGQPIGQDRLAARPAASQCVTCAARRRLAAGARPR